MDAKKRNRLEILEVLRKNSAMSRVDLASQLGLAKAVVTGVSNEMIAEGVIREKKTTEKLIKEKQGRGRRKILLEVNENYRLALGAAFEREKISIGLTNLKGEKLDSDVIYYSQEFSYREVLSKLVDRLNQFLRDSCISAEKLLGLGICLAKDGATLTEGATISDKLNRIRRDLSYALPLKIVSASFMQGIFAAQKYFSGEDSEQLFFIRFGEKMDSAFSVKSDIYQGAAGTAGGIPAILTDEFINKVKGKRKDQEEEINRELAKLISFCRLIIDPEKTYVLGDYLEEPKRLKEVSRLLKEEYSQSDSLLPSLVGEKNLYLTGCAYLVKKCFYQGE